MDGGGGESEDVLDEADADGEILGGLTTTFRLFRCRGSGSASASASASALGSTALIPLLAGCEMNPNTSRPTCLCLPSRAEVDCLREVTV